MTVLRGQRECAQIRPLLDGYVSNELLVETGVEVMRHVAECPECLAELNGREQVRANVRRAVQGVRAPSGLEAQILRGIRSNGRRRDPGWRVLTSIAAAVALLVLAGAAYFHRRVDGILHAGFANHLSCTLAGHYPDAIPAQEAMEQRLERYAPLLTAVRGGLGDGYRIRQGHQCGSSRRFAHVILQKDTVLMSVSVTRKAARESYPWKRWAPRLHSAAFQGLEVAGFETGGHLVFVSSNQDRGENRASAERLRATLSLD